MTTSYILAVIYKLLEKATNTNAKEHLEALGYISDAMELIEKELKRQCY